ncbi:MAG: class I SAM-dependent rRNA methyltransferase [Acidobacteriota bacterium]
MKEVFAKRRTLTLKRGKERVVANRHPWIFTGAIHGGHGPEDAAFADLVDGAGRSIASGFHSRHSQIRMRALTFGADELTSDLIVSRLVRSIGRRAPLFDDATNAARLVHAEGDDLSSIVIDRYADVLVVEISNHGAEEIKPLLVETLRRELAPRLIYFKNDLPARKIEQLGLVDEILGADPIVEPGSVVEEDDEVEDSETQALHSTTRRPDATTGDTKTQILESGLRFVVDPREGQKTGFFLDQRENRRLAGSLSADRRVLNLFSYTGAFGVYAAAGGASFVRNVDISAKAIEVARENHALNGSTAEHTVADAFQFVRSSSERYDLLICDPPAFAKSRGEVDRAARGYKDVNLHAMRMIERGGHMLTFSCSGHMSLDLFQKVIFAAALDAGRQISIIRRLTAGVDHPVSLFCPEGEYLKGFLLEVH